MRISREQMFMEIAHVVAKRSTCARLNVGAIITHENRVVSIGYNGRAPGEAHCEGNACRGVVPGACGTIHAEANAITYLPKELRSAAGLRLYVTHAPCLPCANKVIHLAAISHVYFSTPYRDESGLKALTDCGVTVAQVTPAGYVVLYPSREVLSP